MQAAPTTALRCPYRRCTAPSSTAADSWPVGLTLDHEAGVAAASAMSAISARWCSEG
jgi:hypothetical protein